VPNAAAAPAPVAVPATPAQEAGAPTAKRYVMASLRFRGYDPSMLDNYTRFVQAVGRQMGVTLSGTVPLPRRIRRFTVLRSPHIDKKSREQFEMRTSSRLIQVVNTAPEAVVPFVRYVDTHLPSGIALRITETQHTAVPFPYK
jgi:small subunit ribosomal protein S10